MEKIQIQISGATISAAEIPILTSGMVGVSVVFTFSEEWENLKKTAVFSAGGLTLDKLNLETETTIPWEIMKRAGSMLKLGVYGTNQDGTVAIPTLWVELGEIQPGADPSGAEGADPTLPVWQQVLNDNETVKQMLANKADCLIDTARGNPVFLQADANTPLYPKITIAAKQEGEGVPSPQNICPISGIDKVEIGVGVQTYSAALPEVSYGGSVDWNDGTYTKTHKMITFNGTEAWSMTGSRPGVFLLRIAGIKGGEIISHNSSHYRPVINNGYSIATMPDKTSKGHISENYFYICDLDYTTLEDFKAYLAQQAAKDTPVTVVYRLAAPSSWNLGELTPLYTGDGVTEVSTDGVDMEVTYHANAMALINELRSAVATLGASV